MERWYVVHSHARAEARAVHHLRNQGFDVYLPLFRKRRRHARRTEIVLAPLFPRYLFVRMDIEKRQWRSINGTVGVQYLYCNGEAPVPVADRIIEAIRSREDDRGAVTLVAAFRPGQPLRVVHGPFTDVRGLFKEMIDEERVKLLLNILGRQVPICLPLEAVTVEH